MKELRNEYYAEIERLTQQLKNFDSNEYGFSKDEDSLSISDKIDELEEKISETWTN